MSYIEEFGWYASCIALIVRNIFKKQNNDSTLAVY